MPFEARLPYVFRFKDLSKSADIPSDTAIAYTKTPGPPKEQRMHLLVWTTEECGCSFGIMSARPVVVLLDVLVSLQCKCGSIGNPQRNARPVSFALE